MPSLRVPVPFAATRGNCACGGGCPRCRPAIGIERQRRITGPLTPPPLAVLGNSARGETGHPLPVELQREWGPRLGQDLSWLRVHSGGEAARAVGESGANALNHGHDLFFAPGRYAPQSAAGRALIGHELAHALQSGAAAPPHGGALRVAPRDTALEVEAHRVGETLAARSPAPVHPPAATQSAGLRGDKRITFSGTSITVTDTYVIYGDAATPEFLARFQNALDTYYNSPTFSYRGYTVTFRLSVRMIRRERRTHTRTDREGFEHTYTTTADLDSSFDADTELFEVKTGSGNAGGFVTLVLYEGSSEAVIAHEVGHYLSDRVGYFSERYSEGFFSRLGSIFGSTSRTTTPDPGCEGDIMATLSGTVGDCSLADFLDEAINAHEAPEPALDAEDWSQIWSTFPM